MEYINWIGGKYPILTGLSFGIGAVVLALLGLFLLYLVWMCAIRAPLQAFIFQLYQYKKAKFNGRTVDMSKFWPMWRQAYWQLLGQKSEDMHRQSGLSHFYGWTFVIGNDPRPSFVPVDAPLSVDHLDDDDFDEGIESPDEDPDDEPEIVKPQGDKK